MILKAVCSDDWLLGQLVLKGGNALSLAYNVGNRTSLDLDFSIAGDFADIGAAAKRIEEALKRTFQPVGIIVFDFLVARKPRVARTDWWGGYEVEFKLISETEARDLSYAHEHMRRQALVVDSGSQRRKYVIEISKFEYIGDVVEMDVDGFDVRVYSPVLLAAEKLRALVQQHPAYPQIPKHSKRSRSRDLYDIWAICDYFAVKLEMHLGTVQAVFDAKKVPLTLLPRLSEVKDLHAASWADVENAVSFQLQDFNFYFDFVEDIAIKLYARWIEDAP